jgi:hypothetical protein
MLRRASDLTLIGLRILAPALLAAGAIALVRDTVSQGQDFEVFWRSARAVLAGQAAYDLARDGAMAFKYPPWILPFFFPLAFLKLETAKLVWGLIEVLSLGAIVAWLRMGGNSWRVICACLLGFWGILVVHALDGQIALPMLAISLLLGLRRTAFSGAAVLLVLSTKIFSAISALGSRAVARNARSWALAALLAAAFSLPALRSQAPGWSPLHLATAWGQAAESGTFYFGTGKTRGRDNQGLPAFILRHTGSTDLGVGAEIGLTLLWMAILGVAWLRLSHPLSGEQKWAGWLALAPVVHPLSWFHQFVFALPAAVLCLSAALRSRDRQWAALAVTGIACSGWVTSKTLGETGYRLEMLSIKSWGVLICLGVLLKTGRLHERRA